MEREVGGGIGVGNTCKPMAVSFQCMTKSSTKKKKKNQQQQQKNTGGLGIREAGEIEGGLGYSVAAGGSLPDAATGLAGIPRL